MSGGERRLDVPGIYSIESVLVGSPVGFPKKERGNPPGPGGVSWVGDQGKTGVSPLRSRPRVHLDTGVKRSGPDICRPRRSAQPSSPCPRSPDLRSPWLRAHHQRYGRIGVGEVRNGNPHTPRVGTPGGSGEVGFRPETVNFSYRSVSKLLCGWNALVNCSYCTRVDIQFFPFFCKGLPEQGPSSKEVDRTVEDSVRRRTRDERVLVSPGP